MSVLEQGQGIRGMCVIYLLSVLKKCQILEGKINNLQAASSSSQQWYFWKAGFDILQPSLCTVEIYSIGRITFVLKSNYKYLFKNSITHLLSLLEF